MRRSREKSAKNVYLLPQVHGDKVGGQHPEYHADESADAGVGAKLDMKSRIVVFAFAHR